MEINKIYNENCLETMAKMPDNFIDLTVTSPPYDGLRTYNGYSFDFESIAKELYRVTKDGGVVVWVVGDVTVNGSESGTSFKQALFFKECGFNLHDTMIYYTDKPPVKQKRYQNNFEYMFVFSKGKINKFNPIETLPKRPNHISTKSHRNKEGVMDVKIRPQNKTKVLDNIWYYYTGRAETKDNEAYKHPARFPEKLANDHIISWSNENDLVYDPFMGSGTTAKMAILNNRKYIGSEISEEYCKIIENRIKECGGLFFNSFETELSNEART
jgi:site-specific DNA-methyltransferase (adenine-specific)